MAWLGGYSKRKPITVTGGASGAQTDFQLKLNAVYAAAMQSDFDDLRFTQANGTTLVDAWLESKVNDDSAVVWAEFPTTPANTAEQTYYMYYGNAGAASGWDGAATFLQYHGATSSSFIDSFVINPLNNYAFETRAKVAQAAHNFESGLGRDISHTGDKSFIQSYNTAGHNLRYLQTLNDGSHTQASETPCFSVDTWYNGLITYDGTTTRGYWDLNEIGAGSTTNLPNQLMGIYFNPWTSGGEIAWSFARKYVANPPTYAFGSEESAPVGGAAPTSIFYGPFVGPLGGAI